jgi:hypothetical protein
LLCEISARPNSQRAHEEELHFCGFPGSDLHHFTDRAVHFFFANHSVVGRNQVNGAIARGKPIRETAPADKLRRSRAATDQLELPLSARRSVNAGIARHLELNGGCVRAAAWILRRSQRADDQLRSSGSVV